MVEELLSKSAIEGATSKAIADAAMLEVASVTMGQMVGSDYMIYKMSDEVDTVYPRNPLLILGTVKGSNH